MTKLIKNAKEQYLVDFLFPHLLNNNEKETLGDYKEEIDFLGSTQGKEIFVKEIKENIAHISEYEKSKTYPIPISLILFEEKEEIVKKSLIKINTKNIIIGSFIIIGLGLIFLGLTTPKTFSEDEKLKEIEYIKNDFDLLTEKINQNNLYIQKELQKQKLYRDEKQKLNQKIDSSKNEVNSLEKQNIEIRKNLIDLAQ